MLTIGAIVWGVQNLPQSIQFWSAALSYQLAREPAVVVFLIGGTTTP
jgi:hypothetical protein